MNFKPSGRKLLVKAVPSKETTDSGIILPSYGINNFDVVDVILAGNSCKEVKAGDRVIIGKGKGLTYFHNNEAHRIVYEYDTLVIFDIPPKAIGNRVLVKLVSTRKTTDSGILLPESLRYEFETAIVVSSGKDAEEVFPGERVVFKTGSGAKINIDDEDYLLVEQKNILLAFEKQLQ